MTIVATHTTGFSEVVKYELAPEKGVCRSAVVINDAAATFKVGAVIGKVTLTGKWKLVEAIATDGSQVAAGVVIADANGVSLDMAIPATTDTTVLALVTGPAIVSQDYLTYGATVNTDPEKLALYAQLEAVGIRVTNTAA